MGKQLKIGMELFCVSINGDLFETEILSIAKRPGTITLVGFSTNVFMPYHKINPNVDSDSFSHNTIEVFAGERSYIFTDKKLAKEAMVKRILPDALKEKERLIENMKNHYFRNLNEYDKMEKELEKLKKEIEIL